MKEVTVIIAKTVEVECPYCHQMTSGYLSDPRGMEIECEHCDETFVIHKEADIEMM